MLFGLALGQSHTTWEAIHALAVAADHTDLWESAWTGDHFYPFLHDPTGPCLEGWSTLTALAAATRRIRLGVLVSGMPHRHPAVLAKMAATVDAISGGRLHLGLGAAWNELECGAYGIELGSVRTRLDRFEEGVEVIVRLLRDETTTFTGTHYRLTDARCSPKPLQRPHPPVTIGGTGERRTVGAVARWASHWDLGFTPPHGIAHKRDLLAARCAELGRDPGEITVSVVVRTNDGRERRPIADVVADLAAYSDAGCDLALIEATATDPDDAAVELDRLTNICAPLR